MRSYLPNQFIIDLNTLIWSNPNNVMGIFSPSALFEAYCQTLWHSVGKSDYDYGHLMSWVDDELGPNGNPNSEAMPLIVDPNFIAIMQQSVISGFISFVTQNRAYLSGAIIPELCRAADTMFISQDDKSGVVRLQYV